VLWGESGEEAGSAELDRASPSANPVGQQQGELSELKRAVVVLACGLGFAGALAPPALAESGGAYSSVRATIASAECLAGCSGFDSARTGSVVRVSGTAMGEVSRVVFLGARGYADDVPTSVARRTQTTVDVVVPARAASGRLRVINGDGQRSHASTATITIKSAAAAALEARVVGRRVFQDAARKAQLDVLAQKPLNAVVVVARVTDGAVLQSWQLGTLIPGVVRSLTWDGTSGGVVAPIGRYEFRVLTNGAGGVRAAAVRPPVATGEFDLVDHKFPVRGKHTYGEGAAAFGAVRDGHTHQGQDVFAACGTKLVAARGGVVKLNKYQSAAGNYLVIDGDGTDVDYVYMHLQKRSPLTKGTRVMTGDTIGRVGDTGDAQGCHLHFEMWSGPGWFTGGKPMNPIAFLKTWDKYS
jgi:murein DD-endopeptidase MepM/ murein hydrolase activator NlpD